jgi:hypothetical protein
MIIIVLFVFLIHISISKYLKTSENVFLKKYCWVPILEYPDKGSLMAISAKPPGRLGA